MLNLADLQREAHAVASANGQWDTERTFGDCIARVHSELSDALEAYRVHGLEDQTYEANDWESMRPDDRWPPSITVPEGVASELADVVIRVADMAEHYGANLSEEFVEVSDDLWVWSLSDRFESFGDWIGGCHVMASDALWGKWGPHTPDYAPTEWAKCFALLIDLVGRMAAHYDIDLDAAIKAKMGYCRPGRPMNKKPLHRQEPWHVSVCYMVNDVAERFGPYVLETVIVLLCPPVLLAAILANFHWWRERRRTYPYRCTSCRRRIGHEGLCFTCGVTRGSDAKAG